MYTLDEITVDQKVMRQILCHFGNDVLLVGQKHFFIICYKL
jgi:hypothetical protein